MSLGGLQYTPSVSILAYRICNILIANLIKCIEKKKIANTHGEDEWTGAMILTGETHVLADRHVLYYCHMFHQKSHVD